MTARPSVRYVFEELTTAGLIESEAVPRLAEAMAVTPETSTPWFIRALVGFGAWIAALLFLIFLGLMNILSEDSGLLIGLVLCSGTVALRGSRRLAARTNDFLEQLYLALNLAGQGAAIYCFADTFDSELGTALFALVLEVTLVWFYKGAFGRFLSVIFAGIALTCVLNEMDIPYAVDLATLTLAAAAAWVWLEQPRLMAGKASRLMAPVGYGLVFTVLGLLHTSMAFDESWAVGFPTAVGLTLALAYLTTRILSPGDGARTPALLGILVLGTITFQTPGLVGAVALMGLGFYRRNPVLLGLSFAFLVVFGSAYYYHLSITLLAKSGVLVGSGLLCLGMRTYLHGRLLKEAT